MVLRKALILKAEGTLLLAEAALQQTFERLAV